MAHLLSTKYSKSMERTVRGRAIVEKRKVSWNVHDNKSQKSLLRLVQTCFDEKEPSLKRSALVVYPVHVVWLNLNEKQKKVFI